MSGNKNITVRDIAKEAGVSVATVSRVLNGADGVRDNTKEKVQTVIDKYSFRPNALARSLYKKETKIIGCILPDITSYYFARMFLELEKYAHKNGYTMFLCNSMNNVELESMYLNTLEDRQVDGIIFMGGRVNETIPNDVYIEELRRISSKYPVVIINGKIDDDNAYMINTDEDNAIDRMIKFLTENGHHSMALIGGKKGTSVADMKIKAFYQAVKKYGIKEENTYTQLGEFTSKSGYEIFNHMLEKNKLPSAIITMNDEVGIGVLHACLEKGIKVPDDLSIMGYDDVSIAENSYPRLTTFSHPYEEMGKNAIKTMHRLINKKDAVNEQLLRGKIIVRESVRIMA